MGIEPVEAIVPEIALLVEPVSRRIHRLGDELVCAHTSLLPTAHETRRLENV